MSSQVREPGAPIWRAATRCAGGDCVEVALGVGEVLVRDGKDPAGPVQRFSAAEWDTFVEGVKRGEFDLPAD